MAVAASRRQTPIRPLKALVAVSLLAPALVFVVAAWDGYRQAFKNAENRGAYVNRLLEEHAVKTLETIVLLLRQTDHRLKGANAEEIQTSRPLWEELRTFQQMTEQADSIFVLDSEGRNILTTRTFPAPPLDFADRDYFEEQKREDRGVFVGQAYLGRISNRRIFNLSIRRSDPEGSFNGVIGSSAYVTYFENFYAAAGLAGDNPMIALVRDDGAPLVSYPPMGPDASTIPVKALAVASSGLDSVSFGPSDRGVDRLYSYRKVQGFPVYVAYGIDKRSILSGWYDHLFRWGSVTAGVAALLCLTSLIALGRARQEAKAVARWKATSTNLLEEIERRKRAEAALLQAQKLEALGQLTGGIAHDFNNLLTIILGSLSLAERQTDLAKIGKRLGDIRFAAETATALTRQLLAFSRRQELHPEVIDLAADLRRIRSPIEGAMGRHIQLDLDVADDLWPVLVDPAQLEASLLNLCLNARDAMPEGGRLQIHARNLTVSANDDGKVPSGSYVRLCISDTGAGIPTEVLPRIFEPFFTTKDIGKGTGLGMSQVHGFIQQSGGVIDVESAPGKGTTIILYVPRAVALSPAIQDEPHEGRASKGGNVLVVEDNVDVREVIVSLLEGSGYRTAVAGDAREALAVMANGEKFDLLLSDIVMPNGMSGIELAREVRRTWPMLPVVLMTGYPGQSAALHEHEFPVLNKPLTQRKLARSIRKAIEAADAAA
jgi:two-component system NtrC family sensor kinase